MVTAQAFGVPFSVADHLDVSDVSAGQDEGGMVWTTIEDDPAGVRAGWSAAVPTRVREVSHGDRLLLSVDCDPERGYLLRAPGIGAALISSDGLRVRCAPESERHDWNAVLVGQVLPLVATLRGLEVFHAAGVVVDGRAHLLSGPPGVGKTSLAARLVMAGAQLLSDDVIAVDDRLRAYPGTNVLNLREAESRRLEAAPTPGLRALGTALGRDRFQAAPLISARPLGAIYLLERGPAGPGIEPVAHPSPFDLLAATFNLSVQTAARRVHQLDLCARIAERIPVCRVGISPGQSAAELAVELMAHISGQATERL